MSVLEISLLIISGAFLIVAVFSIPSLLQVWRAAKNMSETLETVNQSLPGILRSLEEITDHVNQTTAEIQHRVEGLSLVAGRIQGILGYVTDVEGILRGRLRIPFFHTLSTFVAVGKGVRVFFKVLRSAR